MKKISQKIDQKKYEKQETRKTSSQQVYHQSNRKYALRAWDYNNASQKKISTVLPPPPPRGFWKYLGTLLVVPITNQLCVDLMTGSQHTQSPASTTHSNTKVVPSKCLQCPLLRNTKLWHKRNLSVPNNDFLEI